MSKDYLTYKMVHINLNVCHAPGY